MTHSRAGRFLWSALLVSSGLWAQQTSGITARGRPEDYPVHVSAGGRIYAASLLSNDQVKHIFATNISGKYLVFEVACYPGSGTAMDIHADSFLAEGREKDIVRPADAMTVAARMQHKSTPPQLPSEIGNVQTEANIGYESGTDPYTGRRVHSTYEEVGLGVGNGPNPRASTVPPDWAQDMEVLQRQLEDRALPSGRFAHPVAGYLYFPVALLKKPGKDGYHLKYDGDDADKPVLIFPPKGH